MVKQMIIVQQKRKASEERGRETKRVVAFPLILFLAGTGHFMNDSISIRIDIVPIGFPEYHPVKR